MKIALALPAALLSVLASLSIADAQVWTSNSSSDWNTAANWSGGVPGASSTATFSSQTGLQTTVNVSASDTIKYLYFAASAPAYTITTGSGQTLTIEIASSSTQNAIYQGSTGVTETINGSVIITNSVNSSVNTSFNLQGNLVFGTSSQLTISSDSTTMATTSIGNMSILGSLTVSSGLTFLWNPSSGILYYNPTTQNVSGSILRQAGSASGAAIYLQTNFTGKQVVIGGTSALYGTVYLNSNGLNETAGIVMNATTTGKGAGTYILGSNVSGTATTTVSGAITINTVTGNSSTDQFDVAANNTMAITGQISGTNSGNGTTLLKTGAGTLILAHANTYTATTSVSAGTLLVNAAGATSTNSINVRGSSSSSTATLGGNGSITSGATASTITIGSFGVLAPGSAATGNALSTLTLNMSGSTLAANTAYLSFTDTSASLAFSLGSGLTSSKLALTNSAAGRVSFDGNTINFSDLTSGLLSLGTYTLITSDAANTYQGLGFAADGVTITSGLTIGSGLSDYTAAGDIVSLELENNNIVLVIAVPEPSSIRLVLGSIMGLLGCVWLNRKRNQCRS
jgi:autotransporter-associated beta strand protein